MKIIADTACLLSPECGEQQDLTVIPVCVTINGETYKDYSEITTEELIQKINAGGVPTSSQPAVGDVLDIMESSDEEMVFLTVGDGLSGAYQTAMGARNLAENNERIHVVNTKTLAGAMQNLVKQAVQLKQMGLQAGALVERLKESIESSVSFVIPADFEFLKRSGRLTAITARVGGALKLLPILTQTEDKTRIKPITVKRTWNSAVDVIINRLQKMGVDESFVISVCHGGVVPRAKEALEQIKAAFANVETQLFELSPALLTHGGPGCVVVQAIKK